mgnify:CR=1 FL=1
MENKESIEFDGGHPPLHWTVWLYMKLLEIPFMLLVTLPYYIANSKTYKYIRKTIKSIPFYIYNNIFLLIVGIVSISLVIRHGTHPAKSRVIDFVCLSMCVYFIKDLYYMIKKYPNDLIYFPHHIIGLTTCLISFYFTQYNMLVISYLTYEITTPVLNLAKYYYQDRYYQKNKYILSMLLFVTLFFLVRILFGTYLTVMSLLLVPAYLSAFPVVLQGINYYWLYKIINIRY